MHFGEPSWQEGLFLQQGVGFILHCLDAFHGSGPLVRASSAMISIRIPND